MNRGAIVLGALGAAGGVAAYKILQQKNAPATVWSFSSRPREVGAGRKLRIELPARAVVHWSTDDWLTVQDTETRERAPGVHVAELPAARLRNGSRVLFTFYWPQEQRWEGADFWVMPAAA